MCQLPPLSQAATRSQTLEAWAGELTCDTTGDGGGPCNGDTDQAATQ